MEFISNLCGVLCALCMLAAAIALIVWLVLSIAKNEKKKKAKRFFLRTLVGIVVFTIIGVATFQECEHNWDIIDAKPATCTDNGHTVMVCTLCNTQETISIPAAEHCFTEEVVETATCLETGTVIKTCAVCNMTEETTVDKIAHTYEYIITKAPSLEEKGIEIGTCSACGDILEKEISMLGTKTNPGEVTVTELVAEINKDIDAAKSKYNDKWIKITGKVLSADNVAGMTKFYLYGEFGDSGLRIICWVNDEILKPFEYTGETHTFIGQVREITVVNATEIGDCTIVED